MIVVVGRVEMESVDKRMIVMIGEMEAKIKPFG